MPAVSIVLPTYNARATIHRAVRSILDQSLRDIELIVVDDGSTDETFAHLKSIQDNRLRCERTEHRGVAAAANVGFSIATGEYIARQDADDASHTTRLEKQLRFLKLNDNDVVGCQVRVLDESGVEATSMTRYARWINEETVESRRIASERFVELPIVNPTILAKRAYFELGFRDNDFPEDYDLMLRAAEAGMRFGKAPEMLYDWMDHSARLTRTHPRYTEAAFLRCRQWHLRRGPLRAINEVDLWGVGKAGKPWLRWLQAEGITVRYCYDVNERKIGERIHGVQVLPTSQLAQAGGPPILIAVGSEHARDKIRPQLEARGYQPGHDAWFVA